MFIAWRPLATGRDADDGVKRVVGDLKIVSHPQHDASIPDTCLQRVGASGVSLYGEVVPVCAVRIAQGQGTFQAGLLIIFTTVSSFCAAFASFYSFLCFITFFFL